MRAAKIAPAHYLGHLGLPSYPRPAVGPKFKRGAKFVLSPNFKQARPIFCSKKPKTSASQTETWFPPPVRFPIRTPWAPKLPLHQPRNPGVLRPPPHPTHQPPPSSIMPEPIPRCRRPPQPQPQRPPRLVVEAEAEPSVPEPVQPRRLYPSQFNHAVLHLTAAAPTSPPSTAPELFLLRRPSPPRICFPSADIRPWQHSQQFGHGFVQACTLQNIGFPGKKKKIGATCGGDHTGNRKRYSSSLIRANLTSLLARYSSHRRH